MEFGTRLKEWRVHRRMSQLNLSTEAGISTRHISFLETGRARPTEGMILRLSGVLDIPARDQGQLFSAAGFRPRFATRPAGSLADLPPAVSHAIRLMLERHEPYPGFVFAHDYAILHATEAAMGFAAASGVALAPGVNFLELYLGHPQFKSVVVNWERTAADLVRRVRSEAWLQGPSSALARRIDRLASDPAVAAALQTHPETVPIPVLPVTLKIGEAQLSFITTLTSFGSAQDALVQGILIESFFPADELTRAYFGSAGEPKTNRE